MALKLHPSYITDLQSIGPNLSNLWLKSDVPMFYDSNSSLQIDNPCSMEVINLSDIRFQDRPTITVIDEDGNEIYVTQPILVDETYAVATTNNNQTADWNSMVNKPSVFPPDVHVHAWADITSGKPTTLAGYGITDAFTQTLADARYPQLSVQYSNPSWISGIDASKITTGTIDLARLPALPSSNTIVCTTIPAMSAPDQLLVGKGTVVIESTTGNTYRYSGTGSVILNASYIQQSDLTPDWATITNRPTLISTWTNDSGYLTAGIFSAQNHWTNLQYIESGTIISVNGSEGAALTVKHPADTQYTFKITEGGALCWSDGNTLAPQSQIYLDRPGVLNFNGGDVWGIDELRVASLVVGNKGVILSDDTRLTDARIPLAHTHLWADITDKPSTFTPTAHTHTITNVTGLQTTLDSKLTSASALDPSKVTQTASYRFVTDTEKATWNAKQNAITTGTTAQYLRGDLSLGTFPTALSSFSNDSGYWNASSHPTTIAGYGITDAVGSSDSRLTNARTPLAHNQAWSTITGTPTTLAGYGITDAASSSHTHTFASLTSKPTTLSGYGITDALSSSYVPTWSTITGKPTTLSGYGITDAVGSSDSRLTDARTPINNSYYVQGSNATRSTVLTNFNTVAYSGFAAGNSATGTPAAGWHYLINVKHPENTSNIWNFQIAAGFGTFALGAPPENYYMRIQEGSSWKAWRTLWHDGNFDAASALSRVSSLETRMTGVDNNWINYLAKSGGTMSGALTIGSNGIVLAGAGVANRYLVDSTQGIFLAVYGSGNAGKSVFLETYDTDVFHRKNGVDYTIWDSGNFAPGNYLKSQYLFDYNTGSQLFSGTTTISQSVGMMLSTVAHKYTGDFPFFNLAPSIAVTHTRPNGTTLNGSLGIFAEIKQDGNFRGDLAFALNGSWISALGIERAGKSSLVSRVDHYFNGLLYIPSLDGAYTIGNGSYSTSGFSIKCGTGSGSNVLSRNLGRIDLGNTVNSTVINGYTVTINGDVTLGYAEFKSVRFTPTIHSSTPVTMSLGYNELYNSETTLAYFPYANPGDTVIVRGRNGGDPTQTNIQSSVVIIGKDGLTLANTNVPYALTGVKSFIKTTQGAWQEI